MISPNKPQKYQFKTANLIGKLSGLAVCAGFVFAAGHIVGYTRGHNQAHDEVTAEFEGQERISPAYTFVIVQDEKTNNQFIASRLYTKGRRYEDFEIVGVWDGGRTYCVGQEAPNQQVFNELARKGDAPLKLFMTREARNILNEDQYVRGELFGRYFSADYLSSAVIIDEVQDGQVRSSLKSAMKDPMNLQPFIVFMRDNSQNDSRESIYFPPIIRKTNKLEKQFFPAYEFLYESLKRE